MTSKAILPVLLLACASLAVRAEEAPSGEDQELVHKEQLRQQVAAIFADVYGTPAHDPGQTPLFAFITERLLALGPEIEPFMIAELESPNRFTFNLAAYTLGMLGTPHAKGAFVKAAAAAERDAHAFGRDRKAWLGYSLALMGDPEALDLLDSGKVNAVHKEFVENMSILEVVAVLTAPKCVPKLLEKLDRYGKSDDPVLKERLHFVVRALGRVADPTLRDRILPYLDNAEPTVREAAARALASTQDVSVADRLFAALDGTDPFARFGAASAIEQLKPPDKTRTIVARLEKEQDGAVRGALYRTLAATSGEAAIETLAGYWGRQDAIDRVFLVDAVGSVKSRKGLNLLRGALQDADNRVALHAVSALGALGGGGSVDALLGLLQDPRWPLEEVAIRVLSGLGEERAAPRIAERVRKGFETPVGDPAQREQMMRRVQGLVDLRFPQILPDLRKAIETQPDPTLVDYLREAVLELVAIEERKDDVARWIELLASPEPNLRKLAYQRLAELRAAGAVKPLAEAFGRVEVAEGGEILRSLGRIASPDAAPLLERVLLDPSFDSEERSPLRSMAAWAASRIGGAKLQDVLKRSAERRDGRDVFVLVYLAITSGREALPLLETQRAPRLRWLDGRRGLELERLDWIARELKAGRSIESLNRPPDEIPLS